MTELWIGCHLSCAKGFLHMAQEAQSIGANTFQFFTRNPRGGNSRAWEADDLQAFQTFAREHGLHSPVAHAPYTLNPCSKNPETRDFALRVLREDLSRLALLPGTLYNLHPGSHTGQGSEEGIRLTAQTLTQVLPGAGDTWVLLETMAGKGSEIGRTMEELGAILALCGRPERLGVCLDTCHVWDAGYDLKNPDRVLEALDRAVGLDRLKAVHLNDSKHPCGARRDRHEKLGEGMIQMENLIRFVHHPVIRGLPIILETPNEPEGYAREIRLIRESFA